TDDSPRRDAGDDRPRAARAPAAQPAAALPQAGGRTPPPGRAAGTCMSTRTLPNPPQAWPDLRGWNLYFLSKVILAWMGALDLHILPNLLLLAALLVPLPWRGARIARTVVAIPVAVALYYQDTWWPPFERLLAQPGVLDFSASYWLELLGRFINWQMVALLALLVCGYLLLKPWLRVTTLSVLGMLGMAAMALPLPAGLQFAGGSDATA